MYTVSNFYSRYLQPQKPVKRKRKNPKLDFIIIRLSVIQNGNNCSKQKVNYDLDLFQTSGHFFLKSLILNVMFTDEKISQIHKSTLLLFFSNGVARTLCRKNKAYLKSGLILLFVCLGKDASSYGRLT